MTIVSNSGADAFIKRLPRELRFFLVHGADEGLVHERAKSIIRELLGDDPDPLRLVRLDGEAVTRDPGMLADEARAVSMFGGSRVIWIDSQGRDISAALASIFADPPEDCAVVIKAAALKKGAALRTAFEKSAVAASIECYSDETRSLSGLIDAEAREANLSISSDAREALAALLGADRQTTRNELYKLMLYARGKTRIEIEDVLAIVADAAPSGLDDVIDRALLGDLQGAEAAAGRYFQDSGDADFAMIRLIQRVTLLHRLRVEMELGHSFEAASQALYVRLPPNSARRPRKTGGALDV